MLRIVMLLALLAPSLFAQDLDAPRTGAPNPDAVRPFTVADAIARIQAAEAQIALRLNDPNGFVWMQEMAAWGRVVESVFDDAARANMSAAEILAWRIAMSESQARLAAAGLN